MDAYLCERSWKLVEFMEFVYVLEKRLGRGGAVLNSARELVGV
jgi:hypothetical protein